MRRSGGASGRSVRVDGGANRGAIARIGRHIKKRTSPPLFRTAPSLRGWGAHAHSPRPKQPPRTTRVRRISPETNRNVAATKDLRNRRRVCLGRARRGHWREGALRKRGGLVLVFFKRRPMRAMSPRLAPPSTRTLRPLAPPERLLRTSTTVCRSLRGPGARQRPGTGSLHEQLPGGARDMV